MTYNDIYKKFLIEYDKADVSSSYPSLTNEEIAAILNKAMYALIAQKVTGNNPRKVALDMDSKAMSDIAPLIDTWTLTQSTDNTNSSIANNEFVYVYNDGVIPPVYILGGKITYTNKQKETDKSEDSKDTNKYEETVQLLTSVIADKFKETVHNKPWIKEPIMYVQRENTTSKEDSGNNASKEGNENTTSKEGTCIHILVDSSKGKITNSSLYIRGIMMPTSFAKQENQDTTEFPLSDTVCEELINLAIIFACRNVQDPRLATVVQTKSLEA